MENTYASIANKTMKQAMTIKKKKTKCNNKANKK